MKKIELDKGQFTLVDDEDFDELNKHRWFAHYHKNMDGYYVKRRCKKVILRMHRVIMNAPKKMQVDHKNHDTLDNRKQNLRLCSCSQNCMNTIKHKKFTSKHKGVYWLKDVKKWRVTIVIKRKRIHLGYFDNEEDGARAYNKKAKELFGEFALLNDV